MPSDSVSIDIHASPEAVFDLVHDYARRLEWDPFLREARLLGGAPGAAAGVAARCVARRAAGGRAMETVYVSFTRPTLAAVKMTRGPALLRSFAATIRQQRLGAHTTRVTYRYHFTTRPSWLAPVLEPVFRLIFRRETRRRLVALKGFFESHRGEPDDDDVVGGARGGPFAWLWRPRGDFQRG